MTIQVSLGFFELFPDIERGQTHGAFHTLKTQPATHLCINIPGRNCYDNEIMQNRHIAMLIHYFVRWYVRVPW